MSSRFTRFAVGAAAVGLLVSGAPAASAQGVGIPVPAGSSVASFPTPPASFFWLAPYAYPAPGTFCDQTQIGQFSANGLRCTFMGAGAPRWVHAVPGAIGG